MSGSGVVVAECPFCEWRSGEAAIQEGRTNAEWFARQDAANEYWQHLQQDHRRPPRFVRIDR